MHAQINIVLLCEEKHPTVQSGPFQFHAVRFTSGELHPHCHFQASLSVGIHLRNEVHHQLFHIVECRLDLFCVATVTDMSDKGD